MMTVFFYARLWRRSGVLTDLEFYEIRYSGPAARLLRGFRAVYLGLFFNCVIMATVNLAAAKIANVRAGLADGAHAAGLLRHDDLLRVGLGAVGRAGHRLDPVHDHDDRDLRRRLLRAAAARGRRAAAACSPRSPRSTLASAARLRRLGHGAHRVHHSDHGAVVVGVVSRRRAGRRQLHRAAHARVARPRRTR